MNLKTITQIDAESLIEEFDLLDGVMLDKKQENNLRIRLNEMSNSQTRSHGLSEINLEIIEALTSECMKTFSGNKQANVWEMENWFSIRLHNTLRLTRQEAAKNEIWFFLGIYFYNFILWRLNYTKKGAKIENVLLGLPLAKYSRQILSRCWWMAETTRIGNIYSKTPQINGDLTNQLLDVNMFQIPGFMPFVSKFIEKKNIEKNFRQIVRTFLYLCREFIVAQPLSSFAQEKIDGNKYKKWLREEIKKDYLVKNKDISKLGPNDTNFSEHSEEMIVNWMESVWELTKLYYENAKEIINSAILKEKDINLDELIEKINSQNLLPRTEQDDIKNIFNDIKK